MTVRPSASNPEEARVSISEGAACVAGGGSHRLVAEVQVGLGPEGAAVDARRRRAYVTCSRSDQVSVVDLDRLEVIDQVVVGHEPIDAVLDEQSGRLFVCNLRSSSVTVIDTAAGRVEGTVAVPPYPSALAKDLDRRRLYCGCAAGAAVAVIDMDRLELLATVPAEVGAGDRDRHPPAASLLRQFPVRHGHRHRRRLAVRVGIASGWGPARARWCWARRTTAST